MEVFEVVIALLLGGAFLAAVARRFGAPYPALVALAGAVLALIPGIPTLTLDPELALALFVAPVLSDAAFDASPRDMRANWRPITSLALGAVALTVIIVAVVVKALVPDMPWAAALTLGAIVAPPDAAAATAVLKQLRPPNQLMVILEGESLFNDASALIIYRLAVSATVTGIFSGWSVVPTLLVVTLGSVLLAIVLARIMFLVNSQINDVATVVVVQFCSSFGVWMLAERLHLSGIITLVVASMIASRRAPEMMPARIRVPAWAVWEVAVFVLNVLAFILVGFQLKSISERTVSATGINYVLVATIVCVTVIAARITWVSSASAVSRWLSAIRHEKDERDIVGLNARNAAVVGWCGMRGTVTLVTALALPATVDSGAAFPYRDLIVVTAFGVVLGTLVLQGLTLRPLMLRLRLRDDGQVEHEIQLARVETLRAAVAAVKTSHGAEAAKLILSRYEFQLQRAEAALAHNLPDADDPSLRHIQEVEDEDFSQQDRSVAVVQAANDAQRLQLVALRAQGIIGDAAFQRVEEEIDWAELDWAQILRVGQPDNGES